jgi:hypothetical protein
MADSVNENVIEFLRGYQRATATFCSQNKLGNKVRKLAKEYPEEVQIVAENPDGSIVAHFPSKWVKIMAPSKNRPEMSEEKKQELRERIKEINEQRWHK